MNMQDRQDEVGAILAQIAMIAEDVNVIALEGSGAGCTHAGDVRQRIRHAVSFQAGFKDQHLCS